MLKLIFNVEYFYYKNILPNLLIIENYLQFIPVFF